MSVIKSKSSNSAIVGKIENVEKKSRSHGEIQPLLIKKRGVYVENKFTKMYSKEETDIERSSKHHKHFKTRPMNFPSVRTTLSKLTIGTQYSDKRDEQAVIQMKQKKDSRKQIQAKKKYKSRVLNQVSYQEEKNPVVVIKSGKGVINTSSSYSDNTSNSFQWFPHRMSVKSMFDTNSDITAASSRKTKFSLKDDPKTAVASVKEKDEKKMYDLFVDLLKTTISVCNIEPDRQSESSSNSKVNCDSLTKNNKIKNEARISTVSLKINNNFTRKSKEFHDNRYAKVFLEYQPLNSIKKRSKSLRYTRTLPKRIIPKSNSVDASGMPNRESKRTRYKKFMKFLKEQLTMDTHKFKEPENLYDALKVLAENKRRQESTPQFYDNGSENYECEFKGRKIISSKSRKNKKRKLSKTMPKLNNYAKNTSDSEESLNTSYHSIEVYGLNYKEAPKDVDQDGRKKIMFTQNKASSALDGSFDFNSQELSNYSFQSDVQLSDFDFENV